MKLQILGSGTSTGVPQIGCTCPVCTSGDPHDRRLRASALVHTDEGAVILVDCGPDFRQQMLRVHPFERIDGVLLTHEHYDHVGGLDDLRPYCHFGHIPLYADAYTAEHLRSRMPYCFKEHIYPGAPRIYIKVVEPGQPFTVNGTEVVPLLAIHGRMPILGYRIGGRLGYVTDMTTLPDASYDLLHGVDTLVINALRHEPHPTHQNLEQALQAAHRIGARQTFLIHMSHHIGLHADVSTTLPPQVHLAYDGLEVKS